MDEEEAVQGLEPEPSADHQCGGENLGYELGTVFQPYQVVGYPYQVYNHGGRGEEAEARDAEGGYRGEVGRAVFAKQSEGHAHGEKDGGEEGEAPKTRHCLVVYLAFVGLVEKVLAERYQQYLRNEHAREKHDGKERPYVNKQPGHGKNNE